MKKLACELCGSTDIIKQDGVFVCQACGTKYSVEEAKKLMSETENKTNKKTTTSNTNTTPKLLITAQNEFDAGNMPNAETYCNKLLEIDPLNGYALLLKGKAIIKQHDIERVDEGLHYFDLSIKNIPEKDLKKSQNDIANCLAQHYVDLLVSACELNEYSRETREHPYTSTYLILKNQALESIDKIKGLKSIYHCDVSKKYLLIISDRLLYNLSKVFNSTQYKNNCQEWIENALILLRICPQTKDYLVPIYEGLKIMYEFLGQKNMTENDEEMMNYRNSAIYYYNKYVELQPKNPIKEPQWPALAFRNKGCYIATSVYGSYDCPEVWILRRFRDNTLDKTWYGRLFIKTYYAISPTLVRWFGNTIWFKRLWRPFLDNMVNKLQRKGIQSTPYTDKY